MPFMQNVQTIPDAFQYHSCMKQCTIYVPTNSVFLHGRQGSKNYTWKKENHRINIKKKLI